MAVYNLTDVISANTTLQYLTGLNESVPVLPILITVALMATLMLAVRTQDIGVMLLFASFISSIVTGMFWLSGWMGFHVFVFVLVLAMLASLFVVFSGAGSS